MLHRDARFLFLIHYLPTYAPTELVPLRHFEFVDTRPPACYGTGLGRFDTSSNIPEASNNQRKASDNCP